MFDQLSIEELLRRLEEMGDRATMELIQAILSKGKEAVKPLGRVLQDKLYWEASDDRQWMPLHAVKLLGTIADPEAIPVLIHALVLAAKTGNDWVMEDMPAVFGRMGSKAVEPLMEFIRAHKGENDLWWPRNVAADGLAAVAVLHPEEKEGILSFFHSLFSEDEDPEFLVSVASSLLDINDPSSYPVLEDAFNRELIDENFVSREDLQPEWEEPDEETLDKYSQDLLEFYNPEQVAKRQARWEEKREKEERIAAEKLEELEKSIAREYRRLEAVTKLIERKVPLPVKKIGRNEPCVCGSGKKYKKCCLPIADSAPPKQVLGGRYLYSTYEHMQLATPYDPFLVLESLTSLAFDAANEGHAAKAMEIFRKLEPLAAHVGMLEKLLYYWEEMCYDHPELGEEGLDIIRRLRSFYQHEDEQWARIGMDAADYLGLLGRWEEGRKEYEKLLEEKQDFPLIHIRFARFLGKGGRIEEAVQHYKHVLQMEAEAGKNILEMAAGELKGLSLQYGIELDAPTKEAIDRLLRIEEEEIEEL